MRSTVASAAGSSWPASGVSPLGGTVSIAAPLSVEGMRGATADDRAVQASCRMHFLRHWQDCNGYFIPADQAPAFRISVSHRPVRQCRCLDAVAAWVAPLALSPGHPELVGGRSVAGRHLFNPLVTVGTHGTSDTTEITSPIAQCVCTLQMHCSNLAGEIICAAIDIGRRRQEG